MRSKKKKKPPPVTNIKGVMVEGSTENQGWMELYCQASPSHSNNVHKYI